MVLVDQLQPLLVDISGPPNRPALSSSEVSDLIASLHPPASAADDFLPDQLAAVAASTAITVSADDIPDLISNLPPGSAAGASGWTYALLQSLFKATTNPLMTRRLSETFARLVNCILSGKHPSSLLLRVRSVLIPKSSGGYRPLGIGDALYRLACRAALFQLGPGLGSLLAPLQLGIGISGGCEIGGRVGQLIMASPPTSNLIITSTDLKNGFNELGRSRQLAGLMRFAPGLLRWFQWAYGRPTPLILDGQTVGHSSTGCRQGDPLSSLCFCVGIHGVLEEALGAMRSIIERHLGCSPTGGLFAYIDDITFFYDGCLSSPIEAKLREIFAAHRIPLNMSKCYHLAHPSSELGLGTRSFPTQFHGEPILGCPTGSSTFRQSFAADKVNAATSSLPALALLQPWSSWNLLRFCVSARIGYLARVLEPADTHSAFSLFDDRIDAAVFSLAGTVDPAERHLARWLRCLPLDLNCLGLSRFHGLAGDTACLLSRQATYDFLERHFPELLAGARILWTPIRPGEVEDSLFLAPARLITNSTRPAPPDPPLDDLSAIADPGLDARPLSHPSIPLGPHPCARPRPRRLAPDLPTPPPPPRTLQHRPRRRFSPAVARALPPAPTLPRRLSLNTLSLPWSSVAW